MFLSVWESISQSLWSAWGNISFAILFICMCACRVSLSHAECQRGHRYLGQKQKTRQALVLLSQFSSSACPRARDRVPFAFSQSWAGLRGCGTEGSLSGSALLASPWGRLPVGRLWSAWNLWVYCTAEPRVKLQFLIQWCTTYVCTHSDHFD